MELIGRVITLSFVALFLTGCATAQPCLCDEGGLSEAGVEEKAQPAGVPHTSAEPSVLSFIDAPRHIAPGGEISVALLAEGLNAYIGEISLAPGTEVPVHTHESEEYLFFIEGGGIMTLAGVDYEVGPGTMVTVPEGTEHGFVNGPEASVAFQIFSSPEGAQRFKEWPRAEDGGQ